MTKKPKMVKITSYPQQEANTLMKAASQGKVTAYVQHKETGAPIPIDNQYINSLKSGRKFNLVDVERRYDRHYFKIKQLERRWDMDGSEIMKILIKYNVQTFYKPAEVAHVDGEPMVGRNDICVFAEYVTAIEGRDNLKKTETDPKYLGFNKH